MTRSFHRYPKLNFPEFEHDFKKRDGQIYVMDKSRKKEILLTPEEWVRQNALQYLRQVQNIPWTSIAVEGKVNVNGMNKRYDILTFRSGNPFLLVECKAADIKINRDVFDQIARYNLSIKVPYLWVTNGLNHFFAQIDYENEKYDFLKGFPEL